MQMNPCHFCGETSRLGVQTKWLGRYGRVGAYARCKRCNARGPIVTLEGVVLDVRNERLSQGRKEALRELAVDAWNGGMNRKPIEGLPLFQNTKGENEIV